MSPFQVRSMSGSYAPTNGTSTLRSVLTSWNGNDDIMRPWSGGPKSITGTKMYVHGGGHSDSSCNALASFDFAGTSRPTGWVLENNGGDGAPVSVHTYDGMVDTGDYLFRFGGSVYPSGGFTANAYRFSKAAKTWTNIPSLQNVRGNYALFNEAAGKILVLDRWVNYLTYAFYRIDSNNWSSSKSVNQQWPDDGTIAFDPATNTGLVVGSNQSTVRAFSVSINWSNETVSQTSRSITTGTGPALIWDAAKGVYWCWGWGGQNSSIYEINPSNWTATQHALTGDAPLAPESGTIGHFGRFVFLKEWRAIGSVASRTGAAYVIKLPA